MSSESNNYVTMKVKKDTKKAIKLLAVDKGVTIDKYLSSLTKESSLTTKELLKNKDKPNNKRGFTIGF